MPTNCSEITNFVVLTGKIIGKPKNGFSNQGSCHLQFVLASPKGKFFDLNSCNYIPCIAWGDLAKKLDVFANDFVKISGKINTFKDGKSHRFQIVVEDLEVLNVQ